MVVVMKPNASKEDIAKLAAELEQLKAVPQVLGVIYYEKEDD